jgi:prepilin-type N-terminal cleavage/methylation domain-containing protein
MKSARDDLSVHLSRDAELGTGVAVYPPRTMRDVSPDFSQRGVTLVEMLVVLAIFALIALIGTVQINKTWQRYRLEGASNEIRSFLQSAFTEAGRMRVPVFVRLLPANGGTPAALQVATDSNGTTVLSSFQIPDFISFSTTSVTGLDCNWPCTGVAGACASGTDPRVLQVSPVGRTMEFDGTPVTVTETLVVTHRDMVTGLLTPRTSYTMRVFPLWQALTERGLY